MKMCGEKLLFGVTFLLFSLLIQHCSAICQITTGDNSLKVETEETPASITPAELNKPIYRSELKIDGTQAQIGLKLEPLDKSVQSFDPNEYFNIVFITGKPYLQLKKAIDRDGPSAGPNDDKATFQFRLVCENKQTLAISKRNIRWTIKDINDNSPVFTQGLYSIAVNELTPIGTTIFKQISATDKDVNENADIDYAIVSGPKINNEDIFVITQPFYGYVLVNQTLDFESMYSKGDTTYRLNISATDGGKPSRVTYVPLWINITDGDDQDPAFIYPTCYKVNTHCIAPQYDMALRSNVINQNILLYPRPGTTPPTAVKLKAKDKDTLNSPLVLYVEKTLPAGYQSYFVVQRSTADEWNLIQTQSFQTSLTLQIFIRAEEQTFNKRYAIAILNTVVLPRDNNQPFISSGKVGAIYENSPVGVFVSVPTLNAPLLIKVSDNDLGAGQTVDYDITMNSPVFLINQNHYIEVKDAVLDYETTKSYQLTVTVTEKNVPSPQTITDTITVNVLDRNDNPPIFQTCPSNVNFNEGDYTTQNKIVTIVTATDLDTGSNAQITYTLIDDIGGKFDLRGNQIFAKGVIAKTDQITLTIRAEDNANPSSLRRSSFCSIKLNVLDNSKIKFKQNSYAITVDENQPVQTVVFIASTELVDTTNLQVGYRFQTPVSDFNINSNGNVVTTKPLDRETTSQYIMTMVAFNKVIPTQTTTATLTVNVKDLNDNTPKFCLSNYFFRAAETNSFKAIGTVTATDADLNDNIVYRTSTNQFTISSTGVIENQIPLDYESLKEHKFEVFAQDNLGNTGKAAVTVIVEDIADQIPTFLEGLYEGSIQENLAGRTNILKVKAVDLDSIPSIRYLLTGNFAPFNVDPVTGDIYVTTPLDYETQNSYTFSVTTNDGQNSNLPQTTSQVKINVLDANDQTPVLSPQSKIVQVFENEELGKTLVTITATDGDKPNTPNSDVILSIQSVNPASGSGLFYLNPISGSLAIGKSLTADTQPQYTIVIRGTDRGQNPLFGTTTVTVNVIRNAAAPTCPSVPKSTIKETISANTFVQSITATDNDPQQFGQVTYSLVGEANALNYFQVSATGQITTKTTLIADSALSYKLLVVAKDGGGKTSTCTVEVEVQRNLNDPTLLQAIYQQIVGSGYSLNTPLLKINAIDNDSKAPHNQLEYIIDGFSPYLRVNDNGEVSLTSFPTDLNVNTINATITVKDKGLPASRTANQKAFVYLTLQRNRKAPVFHIQNFETTISENIPQSANVLKVFANDTDSQIVTYSIIGDGDSIKYFQIAPLTGQITMKDVVSNTPTSRFTVRLQAQDNGNPPQTSTAVVTINVQRNLFNPSWTKLSFGSPTIGETDQVGVTLLTVTATDNDKFAPNNEVYYEVVGDNNAKKYFDVSSNGNIFLKMSILQDTSNVYNMLVKAFDKGNPQRSSTNMLVRFNVLRNIFTPAFTNNRYTKTINDNLAPGTSIITVKADDKATDADLNDNIVYRTSTNQFSRQNTIFTKPPTSSAIVLESMIKITTNIISKTTSQYLCLVGYLLACLLIMLANIE